MHGTEDFKAYEADFLSIDNQLLRDSSGLGTLSRANVGLVFAVQAYEADFLSIDNQLLRDSSGLGTLSRANVGLVFAVQVGFLCRNCKDIDLDTVLI
ncbi:hypothetical protein DUI87_09447 [Hirundo rustica rustica]|uniref:Uncharacterized protein n=1 Tax=Hirundo rustica rustica TaxID=333673 RepID=A0A3M0KMT1_HIRRU|nr:hypothetical protein DUI87_09447 [Hirundo rustica rustica]